MRCCTHRDKEAVAVCIVCGRGLCEECSTEVSARGMACRSRCELEARKVLDYRQFCFFQVWDQQKLHRKWVLADLRSGFSSTLLGVALLVVAVYDHRLRLCALFGIVATVFGVLSLLGARYTWPRENMRVCHTCGYNMTGVKSDCCPECGSKY